MLINVKFPTSFLVLLVQMFVKSNQQLFNLFSGASATDTSSNGKFGAEYWQNYEPLWLHSGKFQGDIDGVDGEALRKAVAFGMFNALRNRQLTWPNAIIPYELDERFTPPEIRLLQKAFKTYRKRTCIRFRPRKTEPDFLNIVKGQGCYSQVGKTGGKQEISLGRGCLFNETIVHELMHSLGFWHEHSRADRDEHIRIRWENILPGMDSQFDIVSAAIQDNLGQAYDYRSIMHYGSSAFSRNGHNTIEALTDDPVQMTSLIGTALDLSELDVVKINKLYRCTKREPKKFGAKKNRRKIIIDPTVKAKITAQNSFTTPSSANNPIHISRSSPTTLKKTTIPPNKIIDSLEETDSLSSSSLSVEQIDPISTSECVDHFVDCSNFKEYCNKVAFYYIMKSYCPFTCGQCALTDLLEIGQQQNFYEEDPINK